METPPFCLYSTIRVSYIKEKVNKRNEEQGTKYVKIDSYHIQYNIHTETVIARRGRSPDVAIRFQNSRVSAHFRLLGHGFPRRCAPRNDRKGFIDTLNSRRRAAVFLYNSQYQNRIQRYGLKTNRFPGKPGHFHQKS